MEEWVTADPHLAHKNIILHCNRTPWIYPNPDYDPEKKFHFKHNNPKAVDLKRHDEEFIENWNSRVDKKDRVKILGDFAYKNHRKFIDALNGKKILIKGNHDKMSHDCYVTWEEFDINDHSVFNDVQKEISSCLKRFRNGDIDVRECQDSILKSAWSKFMSIQNTEDIDQMTNACYNKFEGVHEMGVRRNINGKDVTLCHYAMRSWASSCHGAWHLYGHSHGRMPEFDNMFAFDVGIDVWDYAPIPWCVVEEKMKRIQEKIDKAGGRHVDGEFAAKGLYSKDPEERVIETRKKNMEILKAVGIEVKYVGDTNA
jgi:calcineurin-like phosphoesterase family protein